MGILSRVAAQVLAQDGSATVPGWSWADDSDTGFFRAGSGNMAFTSNGSARFNLNGAQLRGNTAGSPSIQNEAASGTNPVFCPRQATTATGLGSNSANEASLIANGIESIRFDNNTGAGNTRMMVRDNDNAALERVSVGAADSGGVGFKLLRIPN